MEAQKNPNSLLENGAFYSKIFIPSCGFPLVLNASEQYRAQDL